MGYAKIVAAVFVGLAAAGAAGCANDTGAQTNLPIPQYLGADLQNMGGARREALHGSGNMDVIEPTTSSKVLSAIVFERVTGRTAYPSGEIFAK